MKYLGIDYGTRAVGVALSDEGGTIAFPRVTLANDNDLIKSLTDLIKKENVGAVVVGDTRTLSGVENIVTKDADAFTTTLETSSTIPIVRVWEAWSSFEAARFAPKGNTHDNAAAAAIILQRYLGMRTDTVQ
jgi:putative Holliday junction resolvase